MLRCRILHVEIKHRVGCPGNIPESKAHQKVISPPLIPFRTRLRKKSCRINLRKCWASHFLHSAPHEPSRKRLNHIIISCSAESSAARQSHQAQPFTYSRTVRARIFLGVDYVRLSRPLSLFLLPGGGTLSLSLSLSISLSFPRRLIAQPLKINNFRVRCTRRLLLFTSTCSFRPKLFPKRQAQT